MPRTCKYKIKLINKWEEKNKHEQLKLHLNSFLFFVSMLFVCVCVVVGGERREGMIKINKTFCSWLIKRNHSINLSNHWFQYSLGMLYFTFISLLMLVSNHAFLMFFNALVNKWGAILILMTLIIILGEVCFSSLFSTFCCVLFS